MNETIKPIIDVRDLHVDIQMDEGTLTPVRGVSFQVAAGETLGLVGESGCGKSLTCKAILAINEKKCVTSGEILFDSASGSTIDIARLNPRGKEIRAIRGRQISMIFQEPMVAFSPMYTIGNQINECTRLHMERDKQKSKAITLQMMKKVGIANAEKRYDQYPHEFSGGMLQRALISMALVCNPRLLIADEPTTALDVTIQAQILELMQSLQKELGMAILFITHDLGTVAKMCDNVAVMYLGKIVEYGSSRDIYKHPSHPYTRGLMGSVHKIGTRQAQRLFSIEGTVPLALNLKPGCGFCDRCEARIEGLCDRVEPTPVFVEDGHSVACHLFTTEGRARGETAKSKRADGARVNGKDTPKELLIDVRNVSKNFASKGICVRAVDDVSFQVAKGETIGIVGESGCGKTTLGRCIARAITPTSGEVYYKTLSGETVNFLTIDKEHMKRVRKEIQMIFQDPYSSLDPRMTVLDIIGEPLKANYPKIHKREREEMIIDIARKVGLNPSYLKRYPHAFSGGQRQRIGTARALILKPQLIICDEAVSALDVSIQAQIINLLKDLQQEMGLTYLFISHDLSVVEHISDKVGVMYLGKMVEFAETEKLFSKPMHPYTEALLSAVPIADPDQKMERIPLRGEIPNPANPPSGCYFHERCKYCQAVCKTDAPPLVRMDGRSVACHFAGQLPLRGFTYRDAQENNAI